MFYKIWLKNYNTSPHRALKFISPQDVTEKNQHKVWAELYLHPPFKTVVKRCKFNYAMGDKVRVSHSRTLFKLKYYTNDVIQGWFYERELTKIDKPEDELWLIDKIIKRRT